MAKQNDNDYIAIGKLSYDQMLGKAAKYIMLECSPIEEGVVILVLFS